MKSCQQPDFEIIRFQYEEIMAPSGEMGQSGGSIVDEDVDFDSGQF